MAIREINCTPDSNIARVAYDDATGDLYIQYVREGTLPYCYHQVPTLTAEGFEKGEKATSYFRAAILNQYQSEKVPSIPDPQPDSAPATTDPPTPPVASSTSSSMAE